MDIIVGWIPKSRIAGYKEVCVYSFERYDKLLWSEILLTYTSIKNVIAKKLCILLQVNH